MPKRQIAQSLEKQVKENDPKSKPKPIAFKLPQSIGNFSNYDKSKQKSLDRVYFRKQVVELAKDLLGKVIVHETQKGTFRAVIVETEAYKAPLDQACHAKNSIFFLKTDNKTDRTKYFWLDGGHLYIYTIYMPTNICLNIVAGLENQPQAVLIRAVQPVEGIEIMKEIRKIKSSKIEDLCNGPGKVGMSLGVVKDTMNGIDVTSGKFRVVDAGLTKFQVGISKRINIDYAGEWIDKPWRFYILGNTFVSKVDPDGATKKKK